VHDIMNDSTPDTEARAVAHEAAQWLALLESGSATAQDRAGLQRWRERSATHERFWQQAQALQQRFNDLPAQLAMASLDRPDSQCRSPARRAALKRALVLAAVLPGAWMISRQPVVTRWRADLSTATGEQRSIRLQYGSLLQINTASAVNVDLGADRRVTLIEGEMALTMADNVPDITLASRFGQVVAHGAELCLRQDDQRCRVSVSRGSAELFAAGTRRRLGAGEFVSLSASGISATERFDPLQPDWRQGVLSVENRPLGAFLREVSRYRPGILRWEPELEALSVTGTFRLDDTDRILDLLVASLPVQVQSRTRYWVTLAPRKISA
jgi:transmembrane sensor